MLTQSSLGADEMCLDVRTLYIEESYVAVTHSHRQLTRAAD